MAAGDECYFYLFCFICYFILWIVAIAFVTATSPIWIPYSIYSKIRYGKWWFFDCLKESSCMRSVFCCSTQPSPVPTPPVSTIILPSSTIVPAPPPPATGVPSSGQMISPEVELSQAPPIDKHTVTVETVCENNVNQESAKIKLKKALELATQDKSLQKQ